MGRTLLSVAFAVGLELGILAQKIDVLPLTRIVVFLLHKQKRRSPWAAPESAPSSILVLLILNAVDFEFC